MQILDKELLRCFDLSYSNLDQDALRCFHAIGVFAQPWGSVSMLQAICGLENNRFMKAFAALCRRRMIESCTLYEHAFWRSHILLKNYAAVKLAAFPAEMAACCEAYHSQIEQTYFQSWNPDAPAEERTHKMRLFCLHQDDIFQLAEQHLEKGEWKDALRLLVGSEINLLLLPGHLTKTRELLEQIDASVAKDQEITGLLERVYRDMQTILQRVQRSLEINLAHKPVEEDIEAGIRHEIHLVHHYHLLGERDRAQECLLHIEKNLAAFQSEQQGALKSRFLELSAWIAFQYGNSEKGVEYFQQSLNKSAIKLFENYAYMFYQGWPMKRIVLLGRIVSGLQQ